MIEKIKRFCLYGSVTKISTERITVSKWSLFGQPKDEPKDAPPRRMTFKELADMYEPEEFCPFCYHYDSAHKRCNGEFCFPAMEEFALENGIEISNREVSAFL